MRIRNLALLFACLLCLLVCVGCDGSSPAVETTVAPETTAAPEPATITIAADGKCLFSVLRPDEATEEEVSTTVNLLNSAEKVFGTKPPADTDWSIPRGRHVDPEFEVLVGQTASEVSKAVYADLPYGSYTIRVVGNKLVVAGWDDEAYPRLRNMVYRLFQDYTKDGVCAIPADYNETKQLNTKLDNVPRYAGDVKRLVDLEDNSYMLYIEKVEVSEFDRYCAQLKDAGYALYHRAGPDAGWYPDLLHPYPHPSGSGRDGAGGAVFGTSPYSDGHCGAGAASGPYHRYPHRKSGTAGECSTAAPGRVHLQGAAGGGGFSCSDQCGHPAHRGRHPCDSGALASGF